MLGAAANDSFNPEPTATVEKRFTVAVGSRVKLTISSTNLPRRDQINSANAPAPASPSDEGSGTLKIGWSKISFWPPPVLVLMTANDPTLVPLS